MDNSKKTVANVIYGIAVFVLLSSIIILMFSLIKPRGVQMQPVYYTSQTFIFAIVTLLISIPALVLTAVSFFSKSGMAGVGIAAIVLNGLLLLLTFIFTISMLRRNYPINNIQVTLYMKFVITSCLIFVIDLCFNKTWKAKHNEAEKFEQY